MMPGHHGARIQVGRSAPGRSRSRRSGRRSAARARGIGRSGTAMEERKIRAAARARTDITGILGVGCARSLSAQAPRLATHGRLPDPPPVADDPDARRRRAAGVLSLQASAATRPRSSAACRPRPSRSGDPPAARPRQAVVDAAGHLPQADRQLRLGPQLGHQRIGGQPVRHAAAGHADGDGAHPHPRHPAGDSDRAAGGLPARLADRPHDHGGHHHRAVDLPSSCT